MTSRASRIVRAVAALAAATLLMLPDAGRIVERPALTSAYAAEDDPVEGRDDLEEESYEDDDAAAEPDLQGAPTLSPRQIQRVTLTPSATATTFAYRSEGFDCGNPNWDKSTFPGLVVGFARSDRAFCQDNAVL